MKNKKRLAVLAMSAVMAMTSMPFSAFAADFSAGEGVDSAVTAEADADVQTLDVEEETADAAAGEDETEWKVDTDVRTEWNYVKDGQSTATIGVINQKTNKKETRTINVEVVSRTEATCTKPVIVAMKGIFGTTPIESGEVEIKDEPALGHDYVEQSRITTKEPTHYVNGTARVTYKCSKCSDVITKDVTLTLDDQQHTYGDWIYVAGDNVKYTTDKDGNKIVEFGSDGKAVLVDDTKDGTYYKTRFCTVDGAEDTKGKETIVEYAKTETYAVITDKSGIVTDIVGTKYDTPSTQLPLKEETLEMENCEKDGYYIVSYYTSDGKFISHEKIEVKAHHYNTYKTAVFATDNDQAQCDVSYGENADKSENKMDLVVYNKSCYLPVEYTEVTHCSAANCPEKDHTGAKYESPACTTGKNAVIATEAKTAAPAGKHVICTDAKKDVAAAVETLKGNELYNKLEEIAKKCVDGGYGEFYKGEYVKITDRPDCETGGDVTVSYICVVDKSTVVETQTVYIAPSDHKRGVPTRANYVAPTCTSLGSYNTVIKCEYCGKVLDESRTVTVEKLPHTNQKYDEKATSGIKVTSIVDKTDDTTGAYIDFSGIQVVDYDGEYLNMIGQTISTTAPDTAFKTVGGVVTKDSSNQFKYEYAMVAKLKTNCSTCGNHEVVLADNLQGKVEVKIVDCKKQSTNGEAGSITLKATYSENGKVVAEKEETVPYYSTIEAYEAKVVPTVKNGITLDSDGIYRYYVDGEFQKDYDGIQPYGGEKFIVVDGVVPVTDAGATGLIKWIDGTWYFLSNARIRSDYTGIVNLRGEMFYVTNGILDTSVTDLQDYYGAVVLFTDGRRRSDVSGLWQAPDSTWYYLKEGRVQTWLNGEFTVDGRTVTVQGGVVVKG